MIADWNLFFPSGTHVLALPTWKSPRIYLPAQGCFRRWRYSSFYPAFHPKAQLYRFLLRSRAAAKLVAVRTVRSSGWPLGDFVRDVLPQVTSVAVLVGTPSPVRRTTAQLRDEKDKVVGYLKYAENAAAREVLRKEHQILSGIPERVGPKPLKYGALGSGEALLITPISGKLLRTALPPAGGVVDLSVSLTVLPPVPLEAHPWVRRIRERGGSEPDPWLEALASKNWPVTVQHGDFAPWNLLRRPDGTVAAIDWEYGTLESFPYLDLVYYILQTSALIYHWDPLRGAKYAVRYLTQQPQLALSDLEAHALVCLASYDAYWKLIEHAPIQDASLQIWRRAIWKSKV